MASLNQNFTIHHLDKFSVQFTITDNDSSLNGASAAAWWGVATGFGSANMELQTSTDGWNDVGVGAPVADYGRMQIFPSYIVCDVPLDDRTETIPDEQGSNRLPIGSYTHECVYSGTGDQQGSVVVATGTLTVLKSLFTDVGNYRA